YNFTKYRKIAYGLSIVVVLLAIGTIFNGFKQGVEFSGGRSFVIRFDKQHKVEDVRNALQAVFPESPTVKTYGPGGDQFDITTDFMINEEGESADSVVVNT